MAVTFGPQGQRSRSRAEKVGCRGFSSKETQCLFVHKEVTWNSCFDTACRVFHDSIKRVESVTFLISSYCCKLLK